MTLRRKVQYGLLSVFIIVFSMGIFAQPLIVSADKWCPYNCDPTSKRPGYAVELLREIFSPFDNQVEYRISPWPRALDDANQGRIAAVIAANKKEVLEHQLVIGKEPIGMARGCVFVPATNLFQYRSMRDLDRLRHVGVVGGTVYTNDFGEWLAKPSNKSKIHAVFGDDVTERRAKMMMMGRLDGIFEDHVEMMYVLNQNGLQGQIVSAGCQKASPLFIAFSPRYPHARELAASLDAGLQKMRKTGALKRHLDHYGLTDWQSR